MNNEVFELYTDYLIVSTAQTSATGLAALTDEMVSHDQVTRLLSAPPASSLSLWKRIKPLVRQIESQEGVLVFDDSIAEKPYTDENEIICWHWDHSKQRNVKGINFLTMLYENTTTALPLSVQLIAKTEYYLDAKSGKLKRRSRVSKNEYLRQMLLYARTLKVPYSYVLADNWYASTENMTFIDQRLKKHFIFAIKSNRLIARSPEQKRQGQFSNVSDIEVTPDEALTIYLEDFNGPLVLVKHIFTNEDDSSGVLFVITNDTALNAPEILDIYHRRESIEGYHKSLKQNASLCSSPTRTRTTQTNHFFASLCAYCKLEMLKLSTQLNHFALKNKLYLNALRVAFEELHLLKRQHRLALGVA